MARHSGANALTFTIMLALAEIVSAQPKQYPAKMTGTQLVRDMLADPFVNDVNHIRRERAMGYIDGVMDSSAGLRWCPVGKSVPHELNYIVSEEISSMQAANLDRNAAELVLAALARLFPCKAAGVKP